MTDKIDTLKYGNLDLPVTDCKVYFTFVKLEIILFLS